MEAANFKKSILEQKHGIILWEQELKNYTFPFCF